MVNYLGVIMPFSIIISIICHFINLNTKLHIILKRFAIKCVKNDNYLQLLERKLFKLYLCSLPRKTTCFLCIF